MRTRQVVPFPQHELQGKWVARVLSGRARLPARAAMDAAVAEHAAQLAARGVPTRRGPGSALGSSSWHVGRAAVVHLRQASRDCRTCGRGSHLCRSKALARACSGSGRVLTRQPCA